MLDILYKFKSLQKMSNVNFDTECKMFGPRLEKFFGPFCFTELHFNNTLCGKLTTTYLQYIIQLI